MMKHASIRRANLILASLSLCCLFVTPLQAQTVYFQDDFEHGLGKWTVSGYDWALTTSDYRSATHSATDSPNGNYPANANVAMTLSSSIDLSSSANPVLTFWHKYATEWYYDQVWVEVSKDGGFTWSNVSANYDHAMTWSFVKLDLSSFKTSRVLVRFRLVSNAGSTVDDGWYIDDVEIKETSSLPALTTSVEPAGSGIITGGSVTCSANCTNQYPHNWLSSGRDWGLVTTVYRSATHSVTDSPGGNYLPYTNDAITLARAIDLSSSVSPVLTFWHKYATEWYYDQVWVEVSKDGGFTWSNRAAYYDHVSTWASVQVDLSAFKTSRVLVRFRLVSNAGSTEDDGWYIDDVEVKELSSSTRYFFDDFEGAYSMPANIVLTATPNAGYTLNSWSGCDSVTADNKCVVAYNISKNVRATFVRGGGGPVAATLVSPNGTINDTTPTYIWNAVSSATWYYLLVTNNDTTRITEWYTAAQAGCAAGSGTCSVTPSTVLAAGSCQWRIQTWNVSGYGPWSDAMAFAVAGQNPPGKATLISPSGSISTTTPNYVWNAVAGATWYYLWVNDSGSSSGKIRTWYTAAEAGCPSGTGTCSVAPSTALIQGAASWWIQTWNDYGYGPWSDALGFTVGGSLPPKATLLSPRGAIASTTPTYMWSAVASSTWYYLWVSDAAGRAVITTWYTSQQAGCISGTGNCSVTPAVALSNNTSYLWWIQTWNPAGYGPWSDPLAFNLPAQGTRIAIVNPDNFRIIKHGYLLNIFDAPEYRSLAYGEVADSRSCSGGASNSACWTGVGLVQDFVGTVLRNAGYNVDHYTAATLPSISTADYAAVIVQDPLMENYRMFSKNVEINSPDLLQYTISQSFIQKILSYFNAGGRLILVGDAVRLLENSTNYSVFTLNFGKTVMPLNPINVQSNPDSRMPGKWPFVYGNPFCGVDRNGSGTYTVVAGSLLDSGTKIADLNFFNGNDYPKAQVWSETLYYPSDGTSLLDVRLQSDGDYVLRGDLCSPPVYHDSISTVLGNFMGYTIFGGRRIYYLASDSFFDYRFIDRDGAWHAGQSLEMRYTTTAAGQQAIVKLLQAALQ